MSMTRSIFVTLCVVVAVVLSPISAAQFPCVYNFGGSPDDYEVTRNGKSIPVEFQLQLHEGDTILVRKPDGAISIQFGQDERERKTICASNTSSSGCDVRGLYRMSTPSKGVLSALLDEIFHDLTDLVRPGKPERVHGYAKGYSLPAGAYSEIHMELLGGTVQKLGAGKRELSIVWNGGVPPFRVVIREDTSVTPLFAINSVAKRRIHTTPLDLNPGTYSLEIADADSSLSGEFVVVPADELPVIPLELGDSQLPAEVRQTAQAAWLWSRASRRWRWEGYIRVASVPEDYTPARELRKALEEGIYPQNRE
jgi:hypothetical protein